MTKRYYKFGETHRTVNGRKQKYCSTCKRWKSEKEFRIDRHKRDGLKIKCKDCDDAYERAYRVKHRGTVKKYLKFEQRHRTVNGLPEKLCSKCGKWKRQSEYHREKSSKDGLAAWCKKCSYTPVADSRR